MKFDFTKGKPARYLVGIYMPDGCYDHLYYHYYREAKRKLNDLKNSGHYEKGTHMSLLDMIKDERKEFITIK
jgi:hypothetical protein